MLGLVLFLGTASLSELETFENLKCLATTGSTCVDERDECDEGEIWTFSCASDICGNQDDPQCYICVEGDNGDN